MYVFGFFVFVVFSFLIFIFSVTEQYKEVYGYYQDYLDNDGLTPDVHIGTPRIAEETDEVPEIHI